MPRHVDAVMRSVLMAAGDDMLRQTWLRQIVSSMGIREDSRSFRGGYLKCRVAQPLRVTGGAPAAAGAGRHVNDFEFMAEG